MGRWMTLALLPAFFACNGEDSEYIPPDEPIDQDGDGYVVEEDCDDFSATINPGAVEICDNIDNNCNDQIDETGGNVYYLDQDGDGYGVTTETINACELPDGYALERDDCDDTLAIVNPGIEEDFCDKIDNDCDESIDENAVYRDYFPDTDGDGFGDPEGETTNDCLVPEGFAAIAFDCDDTSDRIFPGAPERCDGADTDCDTDAANDEMDIVREWFLDEDGDEFGDEAKFIEDCNPADGRYVTNDDDCDDSNAIINPNSAELCDSIDNDCDREVDEEICETVWEGSETYEQGRFEETLRRDCELVYRTEGVRSPSCPGCEFGFEVDYTYDIEESDDAGSVCAGDTHFSMGTPLTEDFTVFYGYDQDNNEMFFSFDGANWATLSGGGWPISLIDYNDAKKEFTYDYGFNDFGPAGPSMNLYYTFYWQGEARFTTE